MTKNTVSDFTRRKKICRNMEIKLSSTRKITKDGEFSFLLHIYPSETRTVDNHGNSVYLISNGHYYLHLFQFLFL